MSLLLTFLAYTFACIAAKSTVYWYSNTNLANNQRIYSQNADVFSGFYFCCGQFEFAANGSFIYKNNTNLLDNIKYFKDKVDAIHVVGKIDQQALENYNGNIPISAYNDAGKWAMQLSIDGFIIDFEPDTHNTTLAQQYNTFLSSFQKQMTSNYPKVSVGMDISDWGILDYYSLYATAKLSIYTSMATTYHGYNITKNEEGVEQELQYLPVINVRAGICSMISGNPNNIKNCGWNKNNLNEFLTFLKSDNINVPRVDIWRADIDNNGYNTSDWFIQQLRTFINS